MHSRPYRNPTQSPIANLERSAKDALCLLALCFAVLYLSSCLELIRRPPAGVPVVYKPQTDTNHSTDTTRASTAKTSNTQSPSAVIITNHPQRQDQQRRNIEEVNRYALWCIENAMWNEAQSHLERALAQDSLSASLHNNLGIVYERLGMTDKARDFYHRAQALNPDKKAYMANLSYFQERQKTTHDSTRYLDIFKLNDDLPRRQGTRRPGNPSIITRE